MNDDVWNGDGKWRSIAEPLWGKNDTFHSRILSVHQAPFVIHAGSPPVCPNSDPSTCFSFSRSGLSCREPNPTSGPGGERRFCWCGQKKKKKHPVFSVSSEPAWDVLLASTAVQIVSSECSPSGHNSQIWYRHSHPGGWIYGAQPDED